MNCNDEIASDSVLQQAYAWLCERRQYYSANDDVWDVPWRWEEIRPQLQAQLRAGVYRLSPVRRLRLGNEDIEVWSALDALVLKATALVLTAHWSPALCALLPPGRARRCQGSGPVRGRASRRQHLRLSHRCQELLRQHRPRHPSRRAGRRRARRTCPGLAAAARAADDLRRWALTKTWCGGFRWGARSRP